MTLFQYCRKHRAIAVYGSGAVGERIGKLLHEASIRVSTYIISDAPVIKSINGIPCQQFSEWIKLTNNDIGILIAVSARYREEIEQLLNAHNISDFYYVDGNSFQEFYRDIHPVQATSFLTSFEPVSRLFGFERGTPIDRYYIESFLKSQSAGMVSSVVEWTLEVEEDVYSRKYFPECSHDILFHSKGMDLTRHATLKEEYYGVFICTQVFNFIYDFKDAIVGAYHILKKGGVMLATVGGNISPVSRYDMERWGHYWGFTYLGIQRSIEEVFGIGSVKVIPYGNAIAATAFVQGLSVEDLAEKALLNETDPDYVIVIGVRAIKE